MIPRLIYRHINIPLAVFFEGVKDWFEKLVRLLEKSVVDDATASEEWERLLNIEIGKQGLKRLKAAEAGADYTLDEAIDMLCGPKVYGNNLAELEE